MSMEQEYVLYLEDLEDFVADIWVDGNYADDEYETLLTFWKDKFRETTALIITDQMVADYMNDFDSADLNNSLRNLIQEGVVDVMWDADKNDFVFKAVG